MKKLPLFCLVLSLPFLSGCGVDKEKLVGKWELESSPDGKGKGMIMEFTSDGKVKLGAALGDKTLTLAESTYEISGQNIKIKEAGKADSEGRVTELTDEKLVIKDAKGEYVYKRKK